MGKKIFQISFILLVIAAFGTVFNHYLKNKISDPADYLNHIESFPQTRISIIDPIIINIPRDFDKVDYKLNTPLKEAIVQFDPEIEGTLYWSDSKTLEFYPDEPLQSNKEYLVKVDINRIYKLKSKIKIFRFRLQTFKQILFINPKGYQAVDSTLVNQNFEGNIVFNDFIDIDNVYQIFTAKQSNEELNIVFAPGKTKASYYFSVEGIKRQSQKDSIEISWDGSEIGIDIKGKRLFEIPSIKDFNVENIELLNNDSLVLQIQFSDKLNAKQSFDSLISIKGAYVSDFYIDNKLLTASINAPDIKKVYVSIDKGVKNAIGVELQGSYSEIVSLLKNEPAVRIIDSSSVFLEVSENFHWEFSAIKLKAVDVRIYKVFSNNVLQFLQTNSMQGINQLERVGSVVYESSISLEDQLQYNPNKWITYQLNVNDFIPEESCIYSVLIGFRKEQAIIDCENNWEMQDVDWSKFTLQNYDANKGNETDSPCNPSFYGFRKAIHHNLYFANLGIMAKTVGVDSLYVWVNNLPNGKPVKNISIEMLNFQQQIIAQSSSDINGMVRFKLTEQPSFIIAKQGKYTTYLKLGDELKNLPLGAQRNPNFKGAFLTLRNYWSPGDSLNIGFVHNVKADLDPNSIMEFALFDSGKKKIYSEIQAISPLNSYKFKYRIPLGSSTGKYTVKVSLGGKDFEKSINIWPPITNQIMPEIRFVETTNTDHLYELSVSDFLKQSGEIYYQINATSTSFSGSIKNYSTYQFPIRKVNPVQINMEGQFDFENKIVFRIPRQDLVNEFGVVNEISAKIMHQNIGFNQSTIKDTILLEQPRLGISIKDQPKHFCDSIYPMYFRLFTSKRKPYTGKQKLFVTVSAINDDGGLREISTEELLLKNGFAKYNLHVPFPEKGKIQLTVSGLNKKLRLKKTIDLNWPDSFSELTNNSFSKSTIKIVNVYSKSLDSLVIDLFSEKQANVLLTGETPEGLAFSTWADLSQGNTQKIISFDCAKHRELSVSAHIVSGNGLSQFDNFNFTFKNNLNVLKPVIFSQQETKAEKEFSFKIKEQNGLAMNYMIGIYPAKQIHIDTAIQYQNFFNSSFTHDDGSAKVFGSNYSNETIDLNTSSHSNWFDESISPFQPFEFILGPYKLEKDQGRNHTINVPQYIGDVELMIFSSNPKNSLYKTAKKTVSVHKPFMIMASLPGQVAPNEEFYLPVNVYSSDNNSRNAELTVSNNSELNIIDSLTKHIWVNYLSTGTTEFKLKSKQRTGNGEIDIMTSDSSFRASTKVKIPIVSNGLIAFNTQKTSLEPDGKWQSRFTPQGVKGTNLAAIEYSVHENIHLRWLLKKLLINQHADIEHMVSSVLPLLFINNLTNLTISQQELFDRKISQTLNKLIYYQLPSGAFSYWVNDEQENHWASTYAAYFMLQAQKKGFEINQAVFNKWLRYQRRKCLTYNYITEGDDVIQSFGLYTLSLAGKPDVRSLHRMIDKKVSFESKWFLEMTSLVLNHSKIDGIQYSEQGKSNTINDPTYGSVVRNLAVQLMASLDEGEMKIDSLISDLSGLLKKSDELSLNSIAFALVAISESFTALNTKEDKSIVYRLNSGKEVTHQSIKPYGIEEIPIEFTLTKTIDITNNSNRLLNVCIDNAGQPYLHRTRKSENRINTGISYFDLNNEIVNMGQINKNDQIRAEINIRPFINGRDVNDMVLVYPVANCFTPLSTSLKKQEFVKQINIIGQNVYVYFSLPKAGATINISLLALYKGAFQQSPLQIYNLYNPQIKTILNGQSFTVD